MATSDEMEVLLVAYADGELDETTAREVEAYIAANPGAQRILTIHRESAALLRAAFSESHYENPPASLPSPKRWLPSIPLYGWTIAASILTGVIGYGAGAVWPNLLISDHERMLDEVAEYHAVYSRETAHLVEVPAAQTDHLKTWLGKRVNLSMVIPDLKGAGLTFAGGRLVVLDGAPVAELMYTREQGLPIALCVLYHKGKSTSVEVENRGDLNLASWEDGSHSFIVVGEADPAAIRALASLAQKQL